MLGQPPGRAILTGLTFYMAFLALDASQPLGIRTVSSSRAFTILAKP